MSRTTRRFPIGSYHRKPRGWKRAVANNARYGAIPPNAWDDIPISKECWFPWELAFRLHAEGKSKHEIRIILKRTFKLREFEIRDILLGYPFKDEPKYRKTKD